MRDLFLAHLRVATKDLPDLMKWRERLLDLFNQEEDLREGLKKAQETIETKLLEKMRRTL